ncbi:TPA: PspC domain-containing protein, partial [Acinetobacter baumannii]|nr:PspC domain-containing protein [Acinetobacter baumannii]HCW5647909.1 PspC domain-containing protein [Acinetobacter baumannii]
LWLVIPKKQPEQVQGYQQPVRTVREEQIH